MTTTPQNRVQRGVPTGGEYAPTVHAEPGITLDQAAPAFPAWPTSLPEPVVDIALDEKGRPVTTLRSGGFEVEVNRETDYDAFMTVAGPIHDDMDDETVDAATDHAYEIHEQIDRAFQAAGAEDFGQFRDRMLGEVAELRSNAKTAVTGPAEDELEQFEAGRASHAGGAR